MAAVEVRPVRGRREQRLFIDLAWELYRGDPNWVPPLRANQSELLGYKSHPFSRQNEVQTFLAWREGRPCGRIAAIVDHSHNRRYGEQRGFFGFFESVHDAQVAGALFDAVRAWHAERGIRKLRGPVNPSMNYECGLLIEGFHSPPTFMMTYNPPFYGELLEGYGFRKTQDLLAYGGDTSQLPEVHKLLGPLTEQAQRRTNCTIRPLDRRRFKQEIELFLDLYNRSMDANWGFVPLTPEETYALANSLKYLLVPELSLFAEAEGRPVGVVFGLPDFNPAIKAIDGRLFPFGFLKLLGVRKNVRRIRVVSINVVPEYQRWGLGLVLMTSLIPPALTRGVQEAEFSWILESNELARLGLEKSGARIEKRYRLYDYGPTEDAGEPQDAGTPNDAAPPA